MSRRVQYSNRQIEADTYYRWRDAEILGEWSPPFDSLETCMADAERAENGEPPNPFATERAVLTMHQAGKMVHEIAYVVELPFSEVVEILEWAMFSPRWAAEAESEWATGWLADNGRSGFPPAVHAFKDGLRFCKPVPHSPRYRFEVVADSLKHDTITCLHCQAMFEAEF